MGVCRGSRSQPALRGDRGAREPAPSESRGRAGGEPGAPAIDPRILLALWLYATVRGVGSARAVERLCEREIGFQWLCGGVGVNYHTLSDFRVAQGDLLDRLLSESVAALCAEGLVSLERLSLDGVRIRASAGAVSFRRRPTLEACRKQAQQPVRCLKREVQDDPAAGERRRQAARMRAASERLERVKAALRAVGSRENAAPARGAASPRREAPATPAGGRPASPIPSGAFPILSPGR